MHFLSGLLGGIIKITTGFFVALGLIHGAIATTTPAQDATTTDASVQRSLQDYFPTTENSAATDANAVTNGDSSGQTPQASISADVDTQSLGTVVCQGTTRQACPRGQSGVCMPNGSYYCTTAPTTQPQNTPVIQSAQQVVTPAQSVNSTNDQPEILGPLSNEIGNLQAQVQTCTSQITNSSGAVEGNAAVEAEAQADSCQYLSSELAGFLTEQSVIQQGGTITQACSTNISNLEKQIYNLRRNALTQEIGFLTTGGPSAPLLGNARAVANTETAQEAPLLQQLQQNLYYCQ